MSDRHVHSSHRHNKRSSRVHPHGVQAGDVVEGPGPLGGSVLYPVLDTRRSALLLRDVDGFAFVLSARRLAGELWSHKSAVKPLRVPEGWRQDRHRENRSGNVIGLGVE